LFVAFDQDAIALLQGMGDRAFLKGVIRNDGEVPRIVDGDDAGTGLRGPGCVLALLVDGEAVGIVLVIADTDIFLGEPLDQPFQQSGLAHPRKPGKAEKRGFELFPVNVHEQDLSQIKGRTVIPRPGIYKYLIYSELAYYFADMMACQPLFR